MYNYENPGCGIADRWPAARWYMLSRNATQTNTRTHWMPKVDRVRLSLQDPTSPSIPKIATQHACIVNSIVTS